MCADHRNRAALAAVLDEFSHLKIPLRFPRGLPNLPPRDSIRITDPALVVRQAEDGGDPELLSMRWSWPGPSRDTKPGRPVFNYRAEGRRFPRGRCLIIADGFYEWTAPEPGTKLKTKWLFTQPGRPFFCIAGLWRPAAAPGDAGHADAFTMLTVPPGPDIQPYHDRQIALSPPELWAAWLDGSAPEPAVLHPSPPGTLTAERA